MTLFVANIRYGKKSQLDQKIMVGLAHGARQLGCSHGPAEAMTLGACMNEPPDQAPGGLRIIEWDDIHDLPARSDFFCGIIF